MSNEFLSQEEVDALLRGVPSEAEEKAGDPAEEGAGPRPYDLARQERIVRGRMPTLEIINDRFARLCRLGLFDFMRRTPEIAIAPVKVIKYGDFVRSLVVPASLNIVHARPLRGQALFVFDPALVFAIVDNLFGGDGRHPPRVEGRDFTPTEQRIIQRLLEVVFEEYRKAWQSVMPLHFEHVRSEAHIQFANVATPTEIVVVATFTIEIGACSGDMQICFPYSMLEPIRDLLSSTPRGEPYEPDTRWTKLLSAQVQDAEVDLVTTLAETRLKVWQLIGLKSGDVIPIEMPDSVTAAVDGVPVFECRYGTVNGRYAIRVERVVAQPDLDRTQGAAHA